MELPFKCIRNGEILNVVKKDIVFFPPVITQKQNNYFHFNYMVSGLSYTELNI